MWGPETCTLNYFDKLPHTFYLLHYFVLFSLNYFILLFFKHPSNHSMRNAGLFNLFIWILLYLHCFSICLLQNMILGFRVSELQMLLGFAGRNKSGRKNELQMRAIELLQLKSDSIRLKIKDLYNSIQ